ncbi:MAG: hypothetical protein CR974_00525 [Gammaproteobacteria bacterium]|nr:MAG: hypothetical protein CR974_00525 [Gammaproteobacteria bacterium]
MKNYLLAGLLPAFLQVGVAQSLTTGVNAGMNTSMSAGISTGNYLQAKAGIASGDDISLYANLTSDPLYPYVAADFYRKNLDRDSEIIDLFNRFYSAPPVRKLHNKWIVQKFNQGDYATVAKNYFHTGNEDADCAYRAAQYQLGNQQAALDKIYGTWMSPNSVSTLCDPVFAIWPGASNPQYRLKRAIMAYHQGNAGFAITLAERLPYGIEQSTITTFANYLRFPEGLIEATPDSLTSTALARELLPTALAKLIKKDSSQYAPFAMQFVPTLRGNARYQDMLSKLTKYLSKRQDPQAMTAYRLMSKPTSEATEALLTYLVGIRDWSSIRQAVNINNTNPMALYWLGRAQEATGQNGRRAYRKAAGYRSYYGFLAADKIGASYQFTPRLTRPSTRVQQQFNQNSSLRRAKLLARYGDAVAARREILAVAKDMLPARKRQLTYWLGKNGFHFEAIYLLGKMRDWDDIAVRFPTPYNTQVQAANARTGTDSTWIYAIIRQESSMDPNAVSRARAKGLMQLIPSTARHMASDLGLSLYGGAIFDPDINTQLGANYLAKMFGRFNNIAMASAAYNAGPSRVDDWMTRDLDDMTIWVEKIPFNETRKYVKRVLEYQQVYAHHLGQRIPSMTDRLEGRYQAVQ